MNYNDNNYIIACYFNTFESIKIYDFKGNKIKEINNSYDLTFYIDYFYDKKSSKYYIITGNIGYIKSFDYNENKLYYKYSENDNNYHKDMLIYNKEKIIELIDSSGDGNIRIWDFHLGLLLKKIKVNYKELYGICLWNREYLFVGCRDKSIKLLNIKNGAIFNELKGHNNEVVSIQKIIHPKYGKCLISQGVDEDSIIIWEVK